LTAVDWSCDQGDLGRFLREVIKRESITLSRQKTCPVVSGAIPSL
jgi:hypothetical protein